MKPLGYVSFSDTDTYISLSDHTQVLTIEMNVNRVQVVNIISGEVSTNILRRDVGRKLPEGSFYSPMSEEFSNHVGRKPGESIYKPVALPLLNPPSH